MNINDLKKVSDLIENGVYDLFNSYRRLNFELSCYISNNIDSLDNFVVDSYNNRINYLKTSIGLENLDLLEKFKKSNSMRVYRCKKRIRRILKSDCEYKLFLTLTFTDKALVSMTQNSRRRVVSRFLKDNCVDYVANIDFGSHYKYMTCNDRLYRSSHLLGIGRGKNDKFVSSKYPRGELKPFCPIRVATAREHYHAVVCSDEKINNTAWKYGIINFKRIRINSKTDLKISKYINKLSSHTNKNLCKCYNLLYARSVVSSNASFDDVFSDNAILTKIHF